MKRDILGFLIRAFESDTMVKNIIKLLRMIDDDDKEFILTYVPEAELLSFEDALNLAVQRDRQAAEELERSVHGW